MLCWGCQGEVSSFRDALSEKEFSISGLCQKCQDETFCDLFTGKSTCSKPCCADEEVSGAVGRS